ncbi:MAG: hypothetical protein HOP12_08445 [Candidatus Eisenbacteria bacterium]|uniref:Carboxypeptidase regulatory-like domain-containing protein n=1 Tax=Eiseniibacteriota bacterium TaxID=2212470 RepID=A0A849SIC6_UNCEI|nr:hypothetical protein [Candidatus Eisenbacteria bacterium]
MRTAFTSQRIRRLVFAILVPATAFALAAPAWPAAPATLSYQGVLTDAAGALVPNGPHAIEFRLYAAESGGAPLWSENHSSVVVELGGFAVVLGSSTPLALAFDAPYWLGVSVDGGAELTPRTVLTASPYALALRLPWAVSQSEPAIPLLSLRNTGASLALRVSPGLEVGASGIEAGRLQIWGSSAPNASILAEGNFDGFGNPRLTVTGAAGAMTVTTSANGDAFLQLPAGSISASEIANEPGFALSRQPAANLPVTSTTTMQTLLIVSLTTPSVGWVVVEADGQHGMTSAGGDNLIALQIDETDGGTPDPEHYLLSGYAGDAPNGSTFQSIRVRRAYFKPAGTHAFRLEARKESPGGTSWLWNPSLTATFMPTSYGGVVSGVTGVGGPPSSAASPASVQLDAARNQAAGPPRR